MHFGKLFALTAFVFTVGIGGPVANAQKLYWTCLTNTVSRANLDGSEPATLVAIREAAPLAIALDLSARKMYWVAADDPNNDDKIYSKVQRANLDGSALEDLEIGPAYPVDIALDVVTGQTCRLLWRFPA